MIESITLNQFGKQVWRNLKDPNLFAERPYKSHLVASIIDESNDDRLHCGYIPLKDLKKDEWVAMTVDEYNRVTRRYKEVYE
jgi:hypothetical protein